MIKQMRRLTLVGVAYNCYGSVVQGKRGRLIDSFCPFGVGKPMFDALLKGIADPFD